MARSSQIYLVCPAEKLGIPRVYAAFTVKYEAHNWASRCKFDISELQLYRTKDNPRDTTDAAEIIPIPWEEKLL